MQSTQAGGGMTDIGTIGYDAIMYIDRTTRLIIKIIGVFSDTILPVLEEAVLGDLANKPWSQIAPHITRMINEKKDILDQMSRDPEIQQALKEWAEAYATIAIQTTRAIQPAINTMIDGGLETLKVSGTRAAAGVINLGINLTEGVVAEIPVVGGVLDIILALVVGISRAFAAAAPVVQFGLEATGTGYRTVNQVNDIVQEGRQRLDRARENITALTDKFDKFKNVGANALENARNVGTQFGQHIASAATGAVQGAVQRTLPQGALQRQYGGAARNKIKRKIQKTTQRIQKTLNKFHGRRVKTRRRV